MFDFRYHALSLGAVFLALGLGIVLGATLGDQVVSTANRDLRSSLRGEVEKARSNARDASAQVKNRDAFIDASFGRIADTRLAGRRVAIVASGTLPQGVESSTRRAVRDAGGDIDSVTVLPANADVAALGRTAGGRFRGLDVSDAGAVGALGRRLGRVLVVGGRSARRFEDASPDEFKGDFRGADAVVFYRDSEAKRSDAAKALEGGVILGLRRTRRPVAGVEEIDTNSSRIPFYEDAGLSSIDNVDTPAGRIALVLVLDGAHGNFGFKRTADAPLPPVGSR
ncbi:MAG: hypothetical protein QOF55_1764 [Thermoleophilaceae bacterium]|nr:hypothetical protein [Thermoleophilaceae bacterium]